MSTDHHVSHYEVWHHEKSGEVWAVEMNDGKVEKCCGPVAAQDFSPDLIDYLPYRQGADARQLESRRSEFIRDPVAKPEA
jgi:hypothetical protein